MKANLYGSILNVATNKQWSAPAFSCSTGNCTWDPIATLAVRSLCSDVTSMLKTSCDTITSNYTGFQNSLQQCNVSLEDAPILIFLNDESRYRTSMNLSCADGGTEIQPLVYNNQCFPVVRYVSAIGNAIGLPGSKPEPVNTQTEFVATECALEPYVVNFQATVSENVYRENVLEEWIGWQNSSGVNADASMDIVFNPSWNSQQGIVPGQKFTITSKARVAIRLFVSYMFGGSFTTMQPTGDGSGTTPDSTTGTTLIYQNAPEYYPVRETIFSLISNNYTSYTNNSHDKLSGLMQNVAQAMTKSLRDASYIANGGVANELAEMAAGETLVAATFINVQWPWLILPVIIWVMSFITWAGTAWETRRLGIQSWGNSILPYLYLYREWQALTGSASSVENNHCVSCEEYVERAEATRVKLWVSGRAAGLSL